jgi:hypothetical protein
VFTSRAGGDNIPDFDLFVGDHDPINQQLDQLPSMLKGRFSQTCLNTLTKILDVISETG